MKTLTDDSEVIIETGNDQPHLAFSPDGKRLATGGYGTKSRDWNVTDGALDFELDTDQVAGGLQPHSGIFVPSSPAINTMELTGSGADGAESILRAVANEMFPENRVSARLW